MKRHPSLALLNAYVKGELSGPQALSITTHIESSQYCKDIVSELEIAAAEEAFSAPDEVLASSDDDMLAAILALPQEQIAKPQEAVAEEPVTIEVNGKSFAVPKSLHNVMPKLQAWKNYGGRVYSASFDTDESDKMSLLYIKAGVKVPQHTHKGLETTLILHGSFKDEDGEYQAGDYLVTDGEVKHTPETTTEDCLCLIVMTDPMIFTQGLARVFNRFGQGMYP
ncbi:ChrR family anti-sigma-E factor [Thaumasiovibrio subtropicus]|uniref:ChrR family anti-sigma-E factor n=1 Tax=Thaumasiovibrio subtropicus TaxID=1891207 RepID=UPI000B35CC23|nr:ChrR family anti-sigma-E factor [Thaumasiovibrio subtropicus]